MSLKNKLEAIKKEVTSKKSAEEIVAGKQTVSELAGNKQALSTKIADLKTMLSQLKSAYSHSESDLADFKSKKSQIEALFTEYGDYLETRGIASVEDFLHDPEFAAEGEIKEYEEAGAAKQKSGQRGKLGKGVEQVADLKSQAKEALPEMDLDFRGQKKAGEEVSPRQASFSKIEAHIQELEGELAKINEQEKNAKQEYLPKIKALVGEKIDEVFNEQNLTTNPKLLNLNLISDEVFRLCGDEFWPEAKETAMSLIKQKYAGEKWGSSFEVEDLNSSLEAEKLIFEVNEIREKHQSLLDREHDRQGLVNLSREMDSSFFRYPNSSLAVKEGDLYPGDILAQAEYFADKNKEAKVVCEKSLEQAKMALEAAKAKIPGGFLAGKDTKHDIEEITQEIEKAEANLAKLSAPDSFYGDNEYAFTNAMFSVMPRLKSRSGKEWALNLREEIDKQNDQINNSLRNLQNQEREALRKIKDDLYQFGSSQLKKTINGFIVPYFKLEDFPQYKSFNDKPELDQLFKGLEGLRLTQAEFKEQIEKESAVFKQEIAAYPDSEAILKRFKELEEKFESDYRYNFQIMHVKELTRNNPEARTSQTRDHYTIKRDLFYKKR